MGPTGSFMIDSLCSASAMICKQVRLVPFFFAAQKFAPQQTRSAQALQVKEKAESKDVSWTLEEFPKLGGSGPMTWIRG